MDQKKFVLSIVIIVVALIFVVGSVAIYASATQEPYKNEKERYSKQETSQPYNQPTVINQYFQQQPVQATPGNNCNQQVTGYYNNQPVVQCVSPGPDSSQNSIVYPNQQVTKVYVQMSGGYYPYPPYYSRYYSYPKYYPYPQHYPYPHYQNYYAGFPLSDKYYQNPW